MPLDIMPVPAAAPGAGPPGPTGLAPGSPAESGVALLFGLLLAQTATQAGPPQGAKSIAVPSGRDLGTQGKAKERNKKEVAPPSVPIAIPSQPGPPPAAALTPAPVPAPSKADPSLPTERPARAAITGKAMDTVPAPGGELLSSQKTNAPAENVVVPSETSVPVQPSIPVIPEAMAQERVIQAHVSERGLPVSVPSPAGPAPTPVGTSPRPVPKQGLSDPATPSPDSAVSHAPTISLTATSPGLQNRPQIANNVTGKNAGGKLTGPPTVPSAPVNTPAEQPVGGQAATVQTTPRTVSKDPVTPRTGHEPQSDPQAPPQVQAAPLQIRHMTPMPPAMRTQMVHQVAQGVEAIAVKAGGNGQQQVTVQLHPKDWGQLNVSVTMTPTTGVDGKVSTQVVAHVIVEHPAVKAALETGRPELRHALREAGLSLDRMTVTVQVPSAGSGTSAGDNRPHSRGSEGSGAGQPAPSGPGGQGGSAFGGNNPPPFAAFADGQPNRRPEPQAYGPTLRATAGEPGREDAPTAVASLTSRVDTRA